MTRPERAGPRRTCIGCRRTGDPSELVRFVRTAPTSGGQQEGSVAIGRTLPGRGAWLCAATLEECADLALRRRAFERALRGPVDAGSVMTAVRTAAMPVRASDQNARG